MKFFPGTNDDRQLERNDKKNNYSDKKKTI